MKPRLAVVVSDLHAGSTSGIMPPGFTIKEGNLINLNPLQKWLWDCWLDCWKWFDKVAEGEDFIMIVNGDAIDGRHHGMTEIWSVDEAEHGIAAYHILKEPAKKASQVFLTLGTETHTKGHEHALAYQMKAKGINVKLPGEKFGGGAFGTLDIHIAKTYCKFDHHIVATSRSYLEATGYSTTMGSLRNEYARAGREVPQVVVRSHRHRFGMFDDGYGLCIVTPPWQLETRFTKRIVPEAVPQVGLVVLDWRDREDGDLPDVKRRLHTIKQPTILNI